MTTSSFATNYRAEPKKEKKKKTLLEKHTCVCVYIIYIKITHDILFHFRSVPFFQQQFHFSITLRVVDPNRIILFFLIISPTVFVSWCADLARVIFISYRHHLKKTEASNNQGSRWIWEQQEIRRPKTIE